MMLLLPLISCSFVRNGSQLLGVLKSVVSSNWCLRNRIKGLEIDKRFSLRSRMLPTYLLWIASRHIVTCDAVLHVTRAWDNECFCCHDFCASLFESGSVSNRRRMFRMRKFSTWLRFTELNIVFSTNLLRFYAKCLHPSRIYSWLIRHLPHCIVLHFGSTIDLLSAIRLVTYHRLSRAHLSTAQVTKSWASIHLSSFAASN